MRIGPSYAVFLLYLENLLFLQMVCRGKGQTDDDEIAEKAKKLAEMMQHDGVKRVMTMTSKNFNTLLKKYPIVVALFHAQPNTSSLTQDKEVLEVVAKMFDGKGVVCAFCNLLKNTDLAEKIDIKFSGMIKIFNKGKATTYVGQRSPDVMVPYITKMFDAPVVVIETKTQKKQFDSVDIPKTIAYLEKNSPEYQEYQEAARSFQPMIQFHVVFDQKLAKSLHLKKLNTLQFLKPFEKQITLPSKVKFKEKNIVQFINDNKRQIMRKMLLENLHEIWSYDMQGYLVAIFARTKTEDGSRFFSLIKSLARTFGDNKKLNFVWIDPEPFPSMKEYWQKTFGIDPLSPTIGAVDIATQTSAWFRTKTLEKEVTLKDLKKWVNDLLNGKIKLEAIRKATKDNEKDSADQEELKTKNGKATDEL